MTRRKTGAKLGRPPGALGKKKKKPRVKFGTVLPKDVAEYLDSMQSMGIRKSDVIEAALRQYMTRYDWWRDDS